MRRDVVEHAGRALAEYRRKRDFSQTAEPPPKAGRKSGHQLMFVIQKHAATRLHYDFRLEMNGVLKSWAVPKGLPTARGDKRLAVHVEDHPLDYGSFEGTIAEGQYGAGTVMVWDIGTYSVQGDDPIEALESGKIHLTLTGKKLKGDWALVRMKQRPGDRAENWLIFKSGEDAEPISQTKDDDSVLTHRSMAIIAGENKAQWESHRAASNQRVIPPQLAAAVAKRRKAATGRTSAQPLAFVEPMKCKLVRHPPQGKSWIYEIKFDGFRTLALKDGPKVDLLSRSNRNLNDQFPAIVEAVRRLPVERAIIDGEVVAVDDQGRSSFQLLQMSKVPGSRNTALVFYVFDLLRLQDRDIQKLPLNERKRLLESILRPEHEPVRLSANIHGDPQRLLDEVRKHGMEGIVAKKMDSKYEPGLRSGAWQKIKLVTEQEFVIGGYTQPKGSRDYFGAILVGYFAKGQLRFVSKVGSGFDHRLLESLHRQFEPLRQAACPFANLPEPPGIGGSGLTRAEMRKCTWLKPKLVCRVRFTEWTRDDHLRQPVFIGMREDLEAEAIGKEQPS